MEPNEPHGGSVAHPAEHVPLAWTEPLEAYQRLRAAGEQAFLLHGAGAHPGARWSFVALSPVRHVRIEGGVLREAGSPDTPATFSALEAMLDAARLDAPCPAPFTGGWVGYLGYECASVLEPTIPRHANDLPDAVFHLCRDAIAFDHATRTATLHLLGPGHDRRRATILEALTATPHPRSQAPDAMPAAPGQPSHGPAPAPLVGHPPNATWTTTLDAAQFQARVEDLRAMIHEGDLFQANLATGFAAPVARTAVEIFRDLLEGNPSPYMALLEYPDFAIVSASPELLLDVHDGTVRSRPIAGTRRRGRDPDDDAAMAAELAHDAKEQAEHTMLVDLVRNDVARIAVPGTVRVPQRMAIERYRHVMHLASLVEGTLRPGTSVAQALAALFPGGTITGAPKHRACQRIHEAEPVARGPYTGCAGYVAWNGGHAWNILIRTLVLKDGRATVHAGSGIVADSQPPREWDEANRKARALLGAAHGGVTGGNPTRLGAVEASEPWRPPAPRVLLRAARVLLVDNYDSFVHNLADYCASLGAAVHVVRNDADWRASLASFGATHVILGPGPGWPRDAGATMDIASQHVVVPVLGVCLGHQALGEASGATVRVHPEGPVHGRADAVHHEGGGLLAGMPSPITATRYHSLVVTDPGPEWMVDAWLADGTVMAMHHRGRPAYGLQFHPESLCTPLGLELVARFLEVSP